jgi:hypothetical protein
MNICLTKLCDVASVVGVGGGEGIVVDNLNPLYILPTIGFFRLFFKCLEYTKSPGKKQTIKILFFAWFESAIIIGNWH